MKNIILKYYYTLVLFGASTKIPESIKKIFKIENPNESITLSFEEKTTMLIKLITTFTPIAWLLNVFNLWFTDNRLFFSVLVWTIIANVFVGGYVHWKNGSFKMKTLLWKNIEMCIIILFTYPILEGINRITGNNIAGDLFQWAIQIGTILYPGSKVIKNVHIWSNGKYPPEFLMKRIYNFQKEGDLKDFFNPEKKFGNE